MKMKDKQQKETKDRGKDGRFEEKGTRKEGRGDKIMMTGETERKEGEGSEKEVNKEEEEREV